MCVTNKAFALARISSTKYLATAQGLVPRCHFREDTRRLNVVPIRCIRARDRIVQVDACTHVRNQDAKYGRSGEVKIVLVRFAPASQEVRLNLCVLADLTPALGQKSPIQAPALKVRIRAQTCQSWSAPALKAKPRAQTRSQVNRGVSRGSPTRLLHN